MQVQTQIPFGNDKSKSESNSQKRMFEIKGG